MQWYLNSEQELELARSQGKYQVWGSQVSTLVECSRAQELGSQV